MDVFKHTCGRGETKMLYCVTTINVHKFFCTYKAEFAKSHSMCIDWIFFPPYVHGFNFPSLSVVAGFLSELGSFFSPPVVEKRRSGSFLFRSFPLPYRESAWHMITSLSDACLTECLSCCNHYLTHTLSV